MNRARARPWREEARSTMTRHLLIATLAVALSIPWAAASPHRAAAVEKPARPALSEDQLARLRAGEVIVFKTEDPARPNVATATGIVEIETTEEEIFDILTSEAHSEAASKAMKNCTIQRDERLGPHHRQLTVTYLMKVGPTEIEWTVVRDLYEGQGLLEFEIDDSYDNDIAWTAGYYALFPGSSDGKIMIVYVSNLDSGRKIPQWLEEDLTQGSLKRYLRYLKTAAESS